MFEFNLFSWIILPVLIFAARVTDVTLGTLRIIFVSRGVKRLAVLCGFFESFIWLLAVSQIVQNLDNVVSYFAFAAGFATGNYAGMWVEGKLAMGLLAVRVITRADATGLIDFLREKKFGVTSVAARGIRGRTRLIFSIIRRRDLQCFQEAVERFNPGAFISIEDVREVRAGFLPPSPVSGVWRNLFQRK